ncbi:MAG: Rrf2 family transcriptional regulator [Fulvivirga sp.]|uniref:RrF2 family transcriptional regulator n=1 Tax=Fulvivirga sp. TaxID=1931237 RepID=UPI0032EE7BCA
MFSKACEYALKIMIYLNSKREDTHLAGLKEITKAIDSPEAYTAKILQQLVRSKLLISLRGPSGGFKVADRPITLLEIVVAIDGEKIVSSCVLGLEQCSAKHPCPVHQRFVSVRDYLKGVLTTTKLSDIESGLDEGISFLKM